VKRNLPDPPENDNGDGPAERMLAEHPGPAVAERVRDAVDAIERAAMHAAAIASIDHPERDRWRAMALVLGEVAQADTAALERLHEASLALGTKRRRSLSTHGVAERYRDELMAMLTRGAPSALVKLYAEQLPLPRGAAPRHALQRFDAINRHFEGYDPMWSKDERRAFVEALVRRVFVLNGGDRHAAKNLFAASRKSRSRRRRSHGT
jgi:hypothetical protein